MTPECADIVRSWLAKARSDLATAEVLIQGDRPFFDTGVYHCQQAAEKALKGWLTSCGIEFLKVHDLTVLLSSCITSNELFAQFREAAIILSPYATAFRYPGDAFEPPAREAREALALADEIVRTVDSLLKSIEIDANPADPSSGEASS